MTLKHRMGFYYHRLPREVTKPLSLSVSSSVDDVYTRTNLYNLVKNQLNDLHEELSVVLAYLITTWLFLKQPF